MQVVLDSLGTEWEALLRLAPRVAAALLVLGLAVLLGRLLARAVGGAVERGRLSRTHKSFFRRLAFWLVTLIGLAAALNVLGLRAAATGLLAGGGITAVVLGFAFREIGENFLAGFFLAFSRPFQVDDLIQSGDFKGTVRGIELRQTHIRTADGRDIYLPNAMIFKNPLVNFTRDGLLRPTLGVGIDYADDAAEACRLLTEEIGRVAGVLPDPPPQVTVAALEPSFVRLEAGFWIDTFAKGVSLASVRSEILDRCRRALRAAGMTVSADIAANVSLATRAPLEMRLPGPAAGDRSGPAPR